MFFLAQEAAGFMARRKLQEGRVQVLVVFRNRCHCLSVYMGNLCRRSMLFLVCDPFVKYFVGIPVDTHVLESTPKQSAVCAIEGEAWML